MLQYNKNEEFMYQKMKSIQGLMNKMKKYSFQKEKDVFQENDIISLFNLIEQLLELY